MTGVVIALGGKTKDVGETMLTDGSACVINAMKKYDGIAMPLTCDNCSSRREGFGGLNILVSAKSLPRTRNPSRENFEPEEGFFDSRRNLQIPPFGFGNYRLLR